MISIRNGLQPLTAFWLLLLTVGIAGAQKARQENRARQVQQEEELDHFQQWLQTDVLYIITEQEKDVFLKLGTIEEKEHFIEQFWRRRDPNPLTAHNEFKDEHYRRIAYANERFSSGLSGWLTDRGRIYIIHGPPAEIESRPSGGSYRRPYYEGGGSTTTYPFEVWRYRYLEGIGSDVVLEFVDSSLTGEYRLALDPSEKDAFLYVPGAGLTEAEALGLADQSERPYYYRGNEDYPLSPRRARDSPFARYETYSMIQRPQQIEFVDLKRVVDVNISFVDLPFKVREDYFLVNQQRALIPVTLEVDNKNLDYVVEGDKRVAKVAVYGLVTGITGQVVVEFEDELKSSLALEDFDRGVRGRSLYQRLLLLENRGRYKLDLVVRDLTTSKTGVLRRGLVPPTAKTQQLRASSLILSSFVRYLDEVPQENQMFVLGDVWIRPSLDQTFRRGAPLHVYLQLYNAALDQAEMHPSIRASYRILDAQGKALVDQTDEDGQTIQFFSGQRLVLVKRFDTSALSEGQYKVEIEIRDRIKNESVQIGEHFYVTSNSRASR